jgi:hypothetical protein
VLLDVLGQTLVVEGFGRGLDEAERLCEHRLRT